MKRLFILTACLALPNTIPLLAAEDAPKAAALAAAKRLADQPSYTWQTSMQTAAGPVRGFRAAGSLGGDPTTGQTEKDGYTTVNQPSLQFATKAGKAAIFIEE